MALVIGLLGGCSYEDLTNTEVPDEEVRFAEGYLSRLQAGDLDYLRQFFDEKLTASITAAELREIASFFPEGRLLDAELLGVSTRVVDGTWQAKFTFEYRFESGWALANLLLSKADRRRSVSGFDVYRTNGSQRDLNAFTLQGKSAAQLALLAAAMVIPVFTLVTLGYCIATPIADLKGLWVLFVVMGVASLSVNWTTGQFVAAPLHLRFFSVSAIAAGPHAPWIISVSLPLGAVVFWFKRKRWLAEAAAANAAASEVDRVD